VASGTEVQQQALSIHQRLLRDEPTAALDAAGLLLDALVARLRARWPRLSGIEACHDAAVDVFVQYLQAPDRYDPARSSLLGWLTMQAHADLANEHASKQKRFERSWAVESDLAYAEADADRNAFAEISWVDSMPSLEESVVFAAVRKAFPDERDRRLILLMCVEGSRSTDEAAMILGLADRPKVEREAEVRRNKDRVMRRLRRLGLDRLQ
jgi:RNA polymerase sigma-70 factor (ECF subfamily)